jgi:hypothetical protein
MRMAKWYDRAEVVLLVVLGVIFIGAKIHFFTRYGLLSAGAYLEEHWPFWAVMAFVVAIETTIRWIRKGNRGPRSN